jgi:hypothetical protein
LADVEIVTKMIDETSATAAKVGDNLDKMRGVTDKTTQSGEKLKGQLDKTKDSMTGMGKAGVGSFTELRSAIDLATGSMGQVLQTIQEVYQAAKEGAGINQMEESFDRLIDKVGASDDLLKELRAASRGTIDDMRLMSATTTLLAGANGELAIRLADSTPQLLEIAKAANKLNPLLGDTAFLYESIATGVKRASPMILDNLGLTIKIGEANERFAESAGKAVDELTAEEQKLALLEETLRAGNVLIQQAGGNTDSAVDSFARFETATKNASDALKAQFAPAAASAVEGLVTLLTMHDEMASAFGDHENELRTGTRTYQEYVDEIMRASGFANMHVRIKGDEVQVLQRVAGQLRDVTDQYPILTESQWASARADEHLISLMNQYRISADKAAGASGDLADKMEELAKLSDKAAAAQGDLQKAQESYREGVGNDVVNLLRDAGIEGDAYTKALEAIDEETGTNHATTERMNKEMERLVKKYGETGNLDDFKRGIGRITEEFEPFNEEVADAQANLRDLERQIRKLNAMTLTINVEYNEEDFPIPTPNPGGGGGSGDEPIHEQFATGVHNFIVPPGYPNDSYRVGLTSGEVVDVRPPGKTGSRDGGIHFHGDIILQGVQDPEQFIDALMQTAGARAHQASYAGAYGMGG